MNTWVCFDMFNRKFLNLKMLKIVIRMQNKQFNFLKLWFLNYGYYFFFSVLKIKSESFNSYHIWHMAGSNFKTNSKIINITYSKIMIVLIKVFKWQFNGETISLIPLNAVAFLHNDWAYSFINHTVMKVNYV